MTVEHSFVIMAPFPGVITSLQTQGAKYRFSGFYPNKQTNKRTIKELKLMTDLKIGEYRMADKVLPGRLKGPLMSRDRKVCVTLSKRRYVNQALINV